MLTSDLWYFIFVSRGRTDRIIFGYKDMKYERSIGSSVSSIRNLSFWSIRLRDLYYCLEVYFLPSATEKLSVPCSRSNETTLPNNPMLKNNKLWVDRQWCHDCLFAETVIWVKVATNSDITSRLTPRSLWNVTYARFLSTSHPNGLVWHFMYPRVSDSPSANGSVTLLGSSFYWPNVLICHVIFSLL